MSRGKNVGLPALVLSIPGDDGFLGLVHELTRKVAEHAGFDPGTAGRVASTVEEAMLRAIAHAGAGGAAVEVSFRDSGPELRVEVADSGRPRPAPSGASADAAQVMDSVSYRRQVRRNVCSLVKRKEGTRAG